MDRIDRELLRRAWDCLDTFKQAYPENWHEEDEQVMKDLMAADVEFTQRHDPWKNVALRLGEELSSVGPDGYYDMHPGVWLNWAMAQNPRGKNSIPEQRNPLLVFAQECVLGAYQENEIPDAAQRAIEAYKQGRWHDGHRDT